MFAGLVSAPWLCCFLDSTHGSLFIFTFANFTTGKIKTTDQSYIDTIHLYTIELSVKV